MNAWGHYTIEGDRALLLDDAVIRGVIVPAGFRFEASIPEVAQPLIGSSLDPRFMRAACYHDYRYWLKRGSRLDADCVFKDILLEDGVSSWKADLMYLAVRTHGCYRWEDAADRALAQMSAQLEIEFEEGLSV